MFHCDDRKCKQNRKGVCKKDGHCIYYLSIGNAKNINTYKGDVKEHNDQVIKWLKQSEFRCLSHETSKVKIFEHKDGTMIKIERSKSS